MSVVQMPRPTAAQQRVEAIVKAAADLGMGGFALAKLRTTATEEIEAAIRDERARCAEIALAIDSNRGNEKEIADVIRREPLSS